LKCYGISSFWSRNILKHDMKPSLSENAKTMKSLILFKVFQVNTQTCEISACISDNFHLIIVAVFLLFLLLKSFELLQSRLGFFWHTLQYEGRIGLQLLRCARKISKVPGTVRIVFVFVVTSVIWCCWLGGRKGIRPVKNWVVGCCMVICLERGADLHMVQLMPLPLTVSCFSKIQIGFTFLVLAHPGSPGTKGC